MPKVSVIVPAYNTERTISRCLDSILSQTMEDLEVVVVDDGSPDDVVSIVKDYITKDERVRLIRQENQGLGAARNTGVRNANGKYISCVDSDDYIDRKMLELMCDALEKSNADIAICQADNVLYRNGKPVKSLGPYIIPGDKNVISGKEAVRLQLNYIVPILFNSVCFKLIRKDLFIDNNIWFPEGYRFGEDTPTSVGLLLHSNNVALVRENLYFYIREDQSLTTRYSLKKAYDIYLDTQEICQYVEETNYDGTLDNFVLGMLFSMVKQIVWADSNGKKDILQKRELKSIATTMKKGMKPCFSIKQIPLVQKIKILCAYYNWTPIFCRIIAVFKWIPFVKYMI